MAVIKQFGLLSVLCMVFILTECAKDGARRQRRQTCTRGVYNVSKDLSCCLCSAGQYLKSHCSTMLGFATCDPCEDGTYSQHANRERSCMTCKTCENNANLVQKKNCTKTSDTECTCKDGYYCDKEHCKACHACDTCEGLGVKVKCNATSNTVCEEKSPDKSYVADIVVPVVVVVVLLLLGLIVYFKRKKSFDNKPSHTQPEEEEQFEDVDLREHLQDISRALGRRTVRNMTRRILTSVRIQDIEDGSLNDVEEQAYRMLEAWYEKHGRQGAYSDMINYLRKHEGKSKAEDVQKIVKQGQKPNAGAEGNGVV